MILPARKQQQKGQILIIFLLVLVVGVAIVLSVASRTLTDTKTTTTSDESNRAYFAAESGIESALKKISGTTGNLAFSLDFTSVNQTTTNVNAQQFKSGTDGFYAFPDSVAKDDVVQVSLLNDFNNKSSGSYANNLIIYWGNSSQPVGTETAIEVSMVYVDTATLTNFGIIKWAFDPTGTRGNNFCTAQVSTGDVVKQAANLNLQATTYHYNATIGTSNGQYAGAGAGCANPVLSGISPVLLRIKPLYNVTGGNSRSEPIGIQPDTGLALPPQGYVVESSGSTVSGVTRKLKVIQPYPALPAIFDYVLFNGSTQPLVK